MIYAFSVLEGYVSMRGSAMLHIPMFIVMLLWINPYVGEGVPERQDLDWATPGANLWAKYGLVIHAVLGILQGLVYFNPTDGYKIYIQSAQIVGVIGQILNFCMVARLYAISPPMATLTE